MAIENNLPIIFDTATQTEDGLMSFQDKIKLDNMEETLTDKLDKTDKIKSSQLDISSDAVKIQPDNLSDAVKRMMTGQASVEASVPNNGVTTEKIATNAVTIDKIDKRVLLGNVVSPRPLNFVFDSKKVNIHIPMGSLFLTDAVTKRVLVTGCDIEDKDININYPVDFDGLNYIVSMPNGTLSLINHRNFDLITNTSSIMALVSLSTTYEASILMNGNYTINGLAQGIGTESASLMGTGKIIFDSTSGIIDFTNATDIHLIIGGVLNRTIQNQASIRLADYSEDSIYVLYWDNVTSSLKTALATTNSTNTDTDINKIALIKDGRIVPFINTGIFYSTPFIDAPYFTESFDYIDNICVVSDNPINIVRKNENKIEIPFNTFIALNQKYMQVANRECFYENREGIYSFLFDLDEHTLSCKRYTEPVDTTKKEIVVGMMWVNIDSIEVSANFVYTVDGKTPYHDDLAAAEESIEEIKEIVNSDLTENRILSGNDIFMTNEEDLPIYASSMTIKNTEGIMKVVSYNKENNIMIPMYKIIDGNTTLDDTVGDIAKLLVSDKYNTHGYLLKEVKINKPTNTRTNVKVLCIGDDLINDMTAKYLKNKLSDLGVAADMLGTMVNSGVYAEGRDGWFYSTFIGASGRGLQEGKITPQTSKGASTILLNPFLRTANADDKANKPNDCYRASGAYIEKNYYNDTDKNGAFYIFDFANYLEVQGIATPDVVVIALKPELAGLFTEDIVGTNMKYLKQIVAGIRASLPDTYIALIPQYGSSTAYPEVWENTYKMIEETVNYVDTLKDDKIKVVSSWLHMCREFGTAGFTRNTDNSQLYESTNDPYNNKLTENAKIELANSIAAFIMNI